MSMNQEDIVKYKSLYLQTSWGYLNMLRKNLEFLLKGTNGSQSIDAAHLAAHSLKSQSILMGYAQIGKLSECMEIIFKQNKENNLNLDSFTLEIVREALNKLHKSLSQIADNKEELDMSEEVKELETIING